MNNVYRTKDGGQVTVEYVLIFAVTLAIAVLAAGFLQRIRDRMTETRDVGVQLIMKTR